MNVRKEATKLRRMKVGQLRQKYSEVCDRPTTVSHRGSLVKRIIWQLQANEHGGLSDRALQRAEELCQGINLRVGTMDVGTMVPDLRGLESIRPVPYSVRSRRDSRLPMPGTVLTREYRGRILTVLVLEHGFEYEGKVYSSLTAVAREVTGAHWNGFDFMNLRPKRRAA